MKHARFVLVIVLAVCLVLTADLLWNFVHALACEGDTLECAGLFSRLVFGGDLTLSRFANGFLVGVGGTLAIAVANITLSCIALYQRKK